MKRNQRTVTLMMGGPASGKSTARLARFPSTPVIDSDRIKATHPDYDVTKPSEFHAWSSLEATKAFHAALKGSEDFIFDGTGSNAEKYVLFAMAARKAGFKVHAFYVRCDLATALKRNDARERTVNPDVVREKYSTISVSFEIVAYYMDRVEVVNNSEEKKG